MLILVADLTRRPSPLKITHRFVPTSPCGPDPSDFGGDYLLDLQTGTIPDEDRQCQLHTSHIKTSQQLIPWKDAYEQPTSYLQS